MALRVGGRTCSSVRRFDREDVFLERVAGVGAHANSGEVLGQTNATRQRNAARKAQGRVNAARWYELRCQGWSSRRIAKHFGVAESTVSQGILRVYEETKPNAADIERTRAEQLEALQVRKAFWFKKLHAAKGNLEDAERCDRSLHRVFEREAKLTGIDTPVTEKIALEVTAGIASPSKAREAMRSAFGGVGPGGITSGPGAVDDLERVGPDGGERPRVGDPRKEPPAT
jgi:transposase